MTIVNKSNYKSLSINSYFIFKEGMLKGVFNLKSLCRVYLKALFHKVLEMLASLFPVSSDKWNRTTAIFVRLYLGRLVGNS